MPAFLACSHPCRVRPPNGSRPPESRGGPIPPALVKADRSGVVQPRNPVVAIAAASRLRASLPAGKPWPDGAQQPPRRDVTGAAIEGVVAWRTLPAARNFLID